ncbi:hypothetical protein EV182_000857 [Spiromyces aspiralis]|uniref:Uncharacterized protein n=1 Tax=Spiromyces aspiralis TaxID=68401 RepID=A0ACC1HZZ8_9FUNG|nr:hypothetical protein EV182_000857 [Spiromyces aspiralis]
MTDTHGHHHHYDSKECPPAKAMPDPGFGGNPAYHQKILDILGFGSKTASIAEQFA